MVFSFFWGFKDILVLGEDATVVVNDIIYSVFFFHYLLVIQDPWAVDYFLLLCLLLCLLLRCFFLLLLLFDYLWVEEHSLLGLWRRVMPQLMPRDIWYLSHRSLRGHYPFDVDLSRTLVGNAQTVILLALLHLRFGLSFIDHLGLLALALQLL